MKKDIVLSFLEIAQNIIFARRAKVLFFYPQHFNRSAEGTNPYFDPLIEACKKYDISYKLLEEQCSTDKPRNPNAVKADALYWLIIILRKFVRLLHKNSSFAKNEKRVAQVLNILTLGQLKCERYISISGSMNELFIYLNPLGKVYEVQHGIVFGGKDSFYDDDGNIREAYKELNFNLLLWGEGYCDSVTKGHREEWDGRVHATGYPIKKNKIEDNCVEPKNVLVSLQFTSDWSIEKLEQIKRMLVSLLSSMEGSGIKVLLKHHPRYNKRVIDISDIFEKFDFVGETNETLLQLIPKTMLQVTFNSTTAFEFAEYGIPSYFLSNENYPRHENLFYSEYKYPLYSMMDIKDVLKELRDKEKKEQAAMAVKKWYNCFYSPFCEEDFIKIIK